MSRAETELLKELRISQKDVAAALKVSPQRVSQGLRERSAYLSPARLQALYLHLANEDAVQAEQFRERALQVLPIQGRQVLNVRAAAVTADPVTDPPITKRGTPRPWLDSQEIWIFSSRPKEIEQPDYLERMERDFFRRVHQVRSVKRIVYFVSPDVCARLCRYLASSFRTISRSERTEVIVVEAAAVAISPKFLIFDAMSTDPSGFVACEGQDTYARLSRKQLDNILDGLRESGIGGRKDQIFVPPADGTSRWLAESPTFKVQFSSLEVEYDDPSVMASGLRDPLK